MQILGGKFSMKTRLTSERKILVQNLGEIFWYKIGGEISIENWGIIPGEISRPHLVNIVKAKERTTDENSST